MPRHSVPLSEDRSSEDTRYITPECDDSQPDCVCELHEANVRQNPQRAETRYDNLFFHEKAVMSVDDLRNQRGEFTLRGSPNPLNVLSIKEPPAKLGSTMAIVSVSCLDLT